MIEPEEFDEERRRIVRRAGRLVWGVAALAIVVAIGGGALLAWLLVGAGFPFLRTWVILSLLLLAVPGLVHLWPGPRPWAKGPEDE